MRLGISMTCFSFANVLRARKFFWICDAMCVGPLCGPAEEAFERPRAKRSGYVWPKPKEPRETEKTKRPIRNRSLLTGSNVVSALVAYVWNDRAPSRPHTHGYELRKPGLHIARLRQMEEKRELQVSVPRSPDIDPRNSRSGK